MWRSFQRFHERLYGNDVCSLAMLQRVQAVSIEPLIPPLVSIFSI